MNMAVRYLRDSGLANVWINVAKVLVGLTISSVIILENQLGIDPLGDNPSMLTMRCLICEQAYGGKGAQQGEARSFSQTITPDNDAFTVAFVPISSEEYQNLFLQILPKARFRKTTTSEWREKEINVDPKDISIGTDINTRNAVYVEPFNLSDVLKAPKGEIEAGEYCFQYQSLFKIGSKTIPASEIGTLHIIYLEKPVNQYGDFPIALFERVDFPSDLREYNLDSRGVYLKRTNRSDQPRVADGVDIVIDNNEKVFVVRRVPPFSEQSIDSNYYELMASYNDQVTNQDKTISVTFVLRKNVPPQPSYEDSKLLDGVTLYYPKDFYDTTDEMEQNDPGSYYWFCPLHRFIVDPDGFTEEGKATLVPFNITINSRHVGSTNIDNYKIIAPDKNVKRIWRLKVENTDNVGEDDVIFITVSDRWEGRKMIEIHILRKGQ